MESFHLADACPSSRAKLSSTCLFASCRRRPQYSHVGAPCVKHCIACNTCLQVKPSSTVIIGQKKPCNNTCERQKRLSHENDLAKLKSHQSAVTVCHSFAIHSITVVTVSRLDQKSVVRY